MDNNTIHPVLIVDDNKDNLQVLKSYLDNTGAYKVFIASNGKDAIQRTERLQPRLILLDITLPDISGIEVCRHLKKKQSVKDIPVLFVTAETDAGNIAEGFDAGGVDYIIKPIRKEELLARVKTHVGLYISTKNLENIVEERTREIKKTKDLLEKALMATNDGIWDWDIKNRTLKLDPRYYTMAGYKPYEFPEHISAWKDHVHPDDVDYVISDIYAYLDGKTVQYDAVYRFLRKDGGWMWVRSRGKIVEWSAEKQPLRFIGTHSDITIRKKLELEKDILLHEIHHRVKNNLAIIASLVDIQKAKVSGPLTSELHSLEGRIMSMGLVHRLLYEHSVKEIKTDIYFRELFNALMKSYDSSQGNISLHSHIDDTIVSIDEAVPFALIAHEVFTNAFKYAFSSKEEGVLSVSIQSAFNGRIAKMVIEDNGEGGFSFGKGTGGTLIELLSEQLHFTVDCVSDHRGTRFEFNKEEDT